MIRPFKVNDLSIIEQIERECFRVPYAEKMLRESFSAPTFFGLLDEGKEITGYVFATVVLDEANIDRVAVKEKYRSQKKATNLLLETEKLLKIKGVTKLYLEVRKSNEQAKNLYEYLGFKVVGVREKYYEGKEDAFVMHKTI